MRGEYDEAMIVSYLRSALQLLVAGAILEFMKLFVLVSR